MAAINGSRPIRGAVSATMRSIVMANAATVVYHIETVSGEKWPENILDLDDRGWQARCMNGRRSRIDAHQSLRGNRAERRRQPVRHVPLFENHAWPPDRRGDCLLRRLAHRGGADYVQG